MKYMAKISYDGSVFYGFQKLKTHNTVQSELEKALSKINKSQVQIKGAGRTDRGAHALNQAIHFELKYNLNPENIKKAINSIINKNIYVNLVEKVDDNFHARFLVQKKVYQYVINIGKYDPIKNNYLYNYNKNLNVKKMKIASKYLLGFHSYQAFVSGKRNNYDSGIYKIKIIKKNNLLYFTFIGKSFYQYMVRNLVGALLLVGQDKIEPKNIKEMLIKRSNIYNYITVPANGLYLLDVIY